MSNFKPTIEILDKVGAFLGEENIRWFAHVKGLKGRVDANLKLNYKRKHMPIHPIYLREGMQIRNFLRSLPEWLSIRDAVCSGAWGLNKPYSNPDTEIPGVTKQLCNRLLEAYAWTTVLITGTEWENFFALRASPHAEIHMAHLAELMLEAYNNAEVKQLQPGGWHIPFGDKIDVEALIGLTMEASLANRGQVVHSTEFKLKIATARCAQTSYTLLGDDEKPMDIPELIALHDRLISAKHMSPTEHCAQAMTLGEYNFHQASFIKHVDGKKLVVTENGWLGNFRGFTQYRKMFPNENQSDSRVKH